MKRAEIKFEFVEFVPSQRTLGTIYISTEFATAVHDCLCGCGQKVVTPLSPTGWTLTYDGETISLNPSIGNWGFQCRSHYIVSHNKILWAGNMTPEQIALGRQRDRKLRDTHFDGVDHKSIQKAAPPPSVVEEVPPNKKKSFWQRLFGG